jgi:GH43 family beta-xylosidase
MFIKLKRLGTFLLTVVVVSGGAHAVEKKASVLTTDNLKAYAHAKVPGTPFDPEEAALFKKLTVQALKRTSEIRIRDPYILPHKETGLYYMYAQIHNRDESLPAGVEVYWSKDLKQWAGPENVFTTPEGSWGPSTVWAPEVHVYKGKYYLFATLHPGGAPIVDGIRQKGTQIFVADSPRGPFKPFANRPHTPINWMSLDGTLYVEDGQPWMVFCHEWAQIRDGSMELLKLKQDLSAVDGEPVTLFKASEAPWAAGITKNKDGYVTDGPFLFKTKTGKLLMTWSTIGKAYLVGMAISDSGRVAGPWRQIETPLVEKNGGHGMIFRNFEGDLLLGLHHPNANLLERLQLLKIQDEGDRLSVVEEVDLP